MSGGVPSDPVERVEHLLDEIVEGLDLEAEVTVDAAGYRERRRETVEGQADRAAARALETGKEIELEPMTATERKVVHDRLAERSGIETFSEGDEPDRFVVVAPLLDD